ncbi:MAG TPA: hypothetical protein VF331_22285 [Polyangiales bacterium]
MQSLRTATLIGALALAGGSFGCQDATNQSCPAVTGTFQASYQQLEGSCPATFQGNQLSIAKDDVGTVTHVDMRLSDVVRTEVVLKGCTIGMSQAVEAMGRTQSQIDGDLHVESDAAMSGMLMRTVYTDTGSIACHGVYNALFVRQDAVVGGATAASQQAP